MPPSAIRNQTWSPVGGRTRPRTRRFRSVPGWGRARSGFSPRHRPQRCGRGVESDQVALEHGRLDAVIAGLLFMAGMRRSEVSALRWADVADAADRDGVLVTVRRGKTNQEGERRDVRFVTDGVARALRTLRAAAGPVPEGAGGPGRAALAADGGAAVRRCGPSRVGGYPRLDAGRPG